LKVCHLATLQTSGAFSRITESNFLNDSPWIFDWDNQVKADEKFRVEEKP
jgi:hypothetical protein